MAGKREAACTFLAAGDIALDRARPRRAFGALTPRFRRADIAFGNLELPLIGWSAAEKRKGFIQGDARKNTLSGRPEMIEAFVEAGFDALSFANNHAKDYGEKGFFETLERIARSGIPAVGAGENLAAARRPLLLERRGLRVGILAYCSVLPRGYAAEARTPGVNPARAETAFRPRRPVDENPGYPHEVVTWAVPEDLRRMKADVRRLRKRAEVVIVHQHWGTSMVEEVQGFQREYGRACIDAGADLVLGEHAHRLQALEFYKGRLIAYSLGNLIFDPPISHFTPVTRTSALLGCTLTRRGARGHYLIPCRENDRGTPTALSPLRGKGREVFERLEAISRPRGVRMAARGDRILLRPDHA